MINSRLIRALRRICATIWLTSVGGCAVHLTEPATTNSQPEVRRAHGLYSTDQYILIERKIRQTHGLPSRDAVFNLQAFVEDLAHYGDIFVDNHLPEAAPAPHCENFTYIALPVGFGGRITVGAIIDGEVVSMPSHMLKLCPWNQTRDRSFRSRYGLPATGTHEGIDRLVMSASRVDNWYDYAIDTPAHRPDAIFFGARVTELLAENYVQKLTDTGCWINPFTGAPFNEDTQYYAFARDGAFREAIRVTSNQLGLLGSGTQESISKGAHFENLICHSNGCVVAILAILKEQFSVSRLHAMGSAWASATQLDEVRRLVDEVTIYHAPGDLVTFLPSPIVLPGDPDAGIEPSFTLATGLSELGTIVTLPERDPVGAPGSAHSLVETYFKGISEMGLDGKWLMPTTSLRFSETQNDISIYAGHRSLLLLGNDRFRRDQLFNRIYSDWAARKVGDVELKEIFNILKETAGSVGYTVREQGSHISTTTNQKAKHCET